MTAPSPGCIAIIPAAGSGSRLGAGLPKALCKVAGVSLVRRSLQQLLSTERFQEVIITVPPGMEDAFRAEVRGFDRVWIIEGGAERQDSVFKALQFAQAELAPQDRALVAIHDAARCLVSSECICRVLDVAEKTGAATAAIPCVDSVCVGSEGEQPYFEQSLPRNTLWSIQTPQIFRFGLLYKAHQSAASGATDDASLVARVQRVALVTGERSNIKITTADDLVVAEVLLVKRG